MTTWNERVDQHGVFQEVPSLKAALHDAEQPVQSDPLALSHWERLWRVVDAVDATLRTMERGTAPLQVLGTIQSQMAAITSEVRAFIGNQNVSHLEGANNAADAILQQLRLIGIPQTTADAERISESLSRLDHIINEQLQQWRSEAAQLSTAYNKLDSETQALKAEIDSQKGVLSTAITQYQQTFNTTEEGRQAQFLAQQKTRADEYTALDQSRREQFNKATDEQREAYRLLREQARGEHKAIADAAQQKASEFLASMQHNKNEAETLLGIIGNTGLISGYKRVADQEQKVARLWSVGAALSFVGLVAMASFAFLPTLQGGFTWGGFAGRVFVSLTFGILGAYAALLAQEHFTVERRTRRLELELAALGPFIAQFSPEDQVKAKQALMDRVFGQAEPERPGAEHITSGTLKDLLEFLLKALNAKK